MDELGAYRHHVPMKAIAAVPWGMFAIVAWLVATEILRTFGLGYFWSAVLSGIGATAIAYQLVIVQPRAGREPR